MVNQMHRAKGKGYLKWTPHVPNLPTVALTTPQKVWSNWELVKLKKLDFSDHTRIGISISRCSQKALASWYILAWTDLLSVNYKFAGCQSFMVYQKQEWLSHSQSAKKFLPEKLGVLLINPYCSIISTGKKVVLFNQYWLNSTVK